ncbi:hypothetical protein BRADI_5g19527v3 [Brachypodium distachyon]|uniref:Reverse transcriptase zinc-binding domain-containing protein n=1 Tax=Brachypodium distachyon TaxID=15368 RepID=A0A2K2CI74_BRADI|nr:hypothetical protein BRADI_5g19527v3 [Brachypodium distachyon]
MWCPFCHTVEETAIHILGDDCRFARTIWGLIAGWTGNQLFHPSSWADTSSIRLWWADRIASTKPLGKLPAKAFASVFLLTLWEMCKERNRRVFQHKLNPPAAVLALIKEEATLWKRAGARIGELTSGADDVP